jgi:Zn-finger nucleic acid-binding protein
MRCPRCAEPRALEVIVRKGVEFNGCHSCKGILLPKKSVLRVLQTMRRPDPQSTAETYDYFNSLVAAAEFSSGKDASMSCPACKYDMYETENRGVRLDFCMNCQSIWFDAGELQQILARLRRGEALSLIPLPSDEVGHASGLILHLLRDEWL